MCPSYASLNHAPARIIADLIPKIRAFQQAPDEPLHLVTHSLGGLIARAMLGSTPAPFPVARVVMLGPPNQGSEWADFVFRLGLQRLFLGRVGGILRTGRSAPDEQLLTSLPGEVGILAGNRSLDPIFARLLLPAPHDGKVSLNATRLEGMRDHITMPVSHTRMITRPQVHRQVEAFLRSGEFQRD